ncbi:flavoprotein [Nonomuraea endophytica]|uniref:flavoprotein n=1 Tax=Nonomuraea endophytica TaxID=714136 RepID=UPI0037CB3DCE
MRWDDAGQTEGVTDHENPVLYLIGCGAPPCRGLPDMVAWAQEHSWDVCVILTPKATEFADVELLATMTRRPVRSTYRRPEEPDVHPWPPAAIVVAPATFNTINKWAAGISDTLALGLLNESLGVEIPIIVVPNPNAPLAKHPAFIENVNKLRSWGVTVLHDPARYSPPRPEPGQGSPSRFPWIAVREELGKIANALT